MRKLFVLLLALAPLAALIMTAFVLASASSAKVTLPKAGSAQASSKWTFGTGDLVDSSPNIDGSSVYIGSDDDNVYKLNLATGAMVWSFTAGDNIQSKPNIVGGVVYFGSDDNNVYAVDAATGLEDWHFTTG